MHLVTMQRTDCRCGSSNYVVADMSDHDETEDNGDVSKDGDQTDDGRHYRGPVWSYEAKRAPKDTRRTRCEVMDGVYMPPQQQGNVSKWNEVNMKGIHTMMTAPDQAHAPPNDRTVPLAGTRNEGGDDK
jgi:hypothetical protein